MKTGWLCHYIDNTRLLAGRIVVRRGSAVILIVLCFMLSGCASSQLSTSADTSIISDPIPSSKNMSCTIVLSDDPTGDGGAIVPNLIGMSVEDARFFVETLNLHYYDVDLRANAEPGSNSGLGVTTHLYVIEQDPPMGTPVSFDTTVTTRSEWRD